MGIPGVLLAIGLFGCNVISGASDLSTTGEAAQANDVSEKAGTLPEANPTPHSSSSNSNTSSNNANQKGSGTDANGSGTPGTPVTPGTPPPPPPPPADNPVECGATTCHGGNAACCVGEDNKTCTTKGASCLGAMVECGGRENCGAGEVCCLKLVDGQGGAKCTAEGQCGGGSSLIFCRTTADCMPGQACVATTGDFSEHKGCL